HAGGRNAIGARLSSFCPLAPDGGPPAPRRRAARIRSVRAPRTAGPQPHDILRLGYVLFARLGRRGPSPATSCGSPYVSKSRRLVPRSGGRGPERARGAGGGAAW